MALVSAYALLPALLLSSVRGRPPGAWQDYAAAVALWLPVELRWLLDVWPLSGEFRYVLTTLLAINAGIAGFLLVRRLDGIGYAVAWGRRWSWLVLGHFAVFAALAIPLGQAIGFIAFEPHAERVKLLPLTLAGTLLFTAWPEEFLFRGLLQNLFEKSLRSPLAGLLVGAGVFGLSHINNLGFPNWRYVLLATLAGLFYGRVWQKTGSIFASAVVHTLVNTVWGLLFRTL
jgi:membrane protease YdiL (CAAX protease family)